MAFVALGVVIGASCALLRRRVYMMLALTVLLAMVSALGGISLHNHPWVVVAQVFGSVIALQFVYAAVGGASCPLQTAHTARPNGNRPPAAR